MYNILKANILTNPQKTIYLFNFLRYCSTKHISFADHQMILTPLEYYKKTIISIDVWFVNKLSPQKC